MYGSRTFLVADERQGGGGKTADFEGGKDGIGWEELNVLRFDVCLCHRWFVVYIGLGGREVLFLNDHRYTPPLRSRKR